MPMQFIKEMFSDKYNGVIPATLLPVGSLSDGCNMRKISAAGGWKARKGCSMHNTTAIGTAAVKSLHAFKHPRLADHHFIAQCDSKLTDSTSDIPTGGTTFGTDITNSKTISATPGFSDTIGERFYYADGGRLLSWGGATPFCTGFLCWDNSETTYVDWLRKVTDNRSDTEAIAVAAASDKWYVCSPEIAKSISLTLGDTLNAAAATATLKSWQSGAWSDRTATDGTATAGATIVINRGSKGLGMIYS